MSPPRRVLVIVAHPDDEVLGAGGTIVRHVAAGDEVHVVIVADNARTISGPIVLPQAAAEAAKVLGTQPPVFLHHRGMTLDTMREIELSQHIEGPLKDLQPDVVYTHHPNDLNSDHRAVARAVLVGCRPQRADVPRRVLACEIPSSTEWGYGGFAPVVFVDIHGGPLKAKLDAMARYETELRPPPHPRSPEMLRARAALWGQIAGLHAAEPFVLIREIDRC